jgi:hypothetical protein
MPLKSWRINLIICDPFVLVRSAVRWDQTFKAAEVMLYDTLCDLPEPECIHRFC